MVYREAPEPEHFNKDRDREKSEAVISHNIEFLNSHRTFKYSGGFSPLPSHFFFNLINTAHCV